MLRALTAILLMVWTGAGARADVAEVTIPADGLALQARLVRPASLPMRAPIVALHGCGGPLPSRDQQWADILTGAGHPVLFPDSFGSRGLGPQCNVRDRRVRPGRERRADTVAALRWLEAQDFTPKGGAFVIGWSNGGSTVLAAAADGAMPAGLVRGFVAFYPGCRLYADRPDWAPSAPLLILIGGADDWTPPEPCQRLAARYPDRIKLIVYPGAYHDFDVPNRPIRVRTGLAFTANRTGTAYTGTDPAARADAIAQVLAFLQAL